VLQAAIEAFTPTSISPLVALLLHAQCPSQGEAIHAGGGRYARILLATTEGWQSADELPTPEALLAHWSDITSNIHPAEPAGSMHDLLARRGLPPYDIMDLVEWTRTGQPPQPKAQN